MIKRKFILFIIFITLFSIQQTYSQLDHDEEDYYHFLFEKLDEVSIASNKIEHINDAPANVTVITGSQLKSRGYRSVMDLLVKGLPGVTWENAVGNEKNGATVVRGIIYQKTIKVMLNNMVLDDKAGSGYGWAERIPITGIEKVEFIVGPYASLYGRNSYAGVMNIITKKGEEIDGVEISALYGEWDQWQAVGIFGKKIGAWDIYFSGLKNHSENGPDWTKEYPEEYARENREGKISPVTGEILQFDSSVTGDWVNPWDNSEIYFRAAHDNGFEIDLELNRSVWPSMGGFLTPMYYDSPKDATLIDEYKNIRLLYNYSNEEISSETIFHYQEWDSKQRLDYLSGLHRWYLAETQAYQVEQKIHYDLGDFNSLYFSISYEDVEYLPPIGSERSRNPEKPSISSKMYEDLEILNISFQDEISISDNKKLVLGLMFENGNTYEDVYLPRLSYLYKITEKSTLKFLYGGGYILPDAITRNDQNIGAGLSVKGASDLSPENLTSYELNYNYIFNENCQFNLSFFLNKIEDAIVLSPYTDPDGYYAFSYQNRAKKETKGVDFSFDLLINDKLNLFGSFSYLDGSYDQISNDGSKITTNRLPLSTDLHFKIGLNSYLLDEYINIFIYNLYLNDIDTWTDERLDGYNIVDFHIKTTEKFNSNWNLSLAITNIFDEKGFDAPIQDSQVVPKTPIDTRSWTIQLNYKW